MFSYLVEWKLKGIDKFFDEDWNNFAEDAVCGSSWQWAKNKKEALSKAKEAVSLCTIWEEADINYSVVCRINKNEGELRWNHDGTRSKLTPEEAIRRWQRQHTDDEED